MTLELDKVSYFFFIWVVLCSSLDRAGYLALISSQLFGLNVIGLEGGEDGQLLSKTRFQQRLALLQMQPCVR